MRPLHLVLTELMLLLMADHDGVVAERQKKQYLKTADSRALTHTCGKYVVLSTTMCNARLIKAWSKRQTE